MAGLISNWMPAYAGMTSGRANLELDTRFRGYDGMDSSKTCWLAVAANCGSPHPVMTSGRANLELDTRFRGYDGMDS
ncbi:MAG TPA: hypothetical protein VGV16_11310, partial [Gammaproteobacteria bacterium]|nr:hypothetical protein [Gammaproteobacteria bacterium]